MRVKKIVENATGGFPLVVLPFVYPTKLVARQRRKARTEKSDIRATTIYSFYGRQPPPTFYREVREREGKITNRTENKTGRIDGLTKSADVL